MIESRIVLDTGTFLSSWNSIFVTQNVLELRLYYYFGIVVNYFTLSFFTSFLSCSFVLLIIFLQSHYLSFVHIRFQPCLRNACGNTSSLSRPAFLSLFSRRLPFVKKVFFLFLISSAARRRGGIYVSTKSRLGFSHCCSIVTRVANLPHISSSCSR